MTDTQKTPRWYCVNREGMATLCANERDAHQVADDCNALYPRSAPHRAMQLVYANQRQCSISNDLVARMRGFEVDHEPDGWPGIRMREVSALCDEVEALREQLAAAQAIIADIKAWDVSQFLLIPHHLRARMQAELDRAAIRAKAAA
jgi:hypothetical protein